MRDSESLATVAPSVLQASAVFLGDLGGYALERWRSRGGDIPGNRRSPIEQRPVPPELLPPPNLLEGRFQPMAIDLSIVAQLAGLLRDASRYVRDYAAAEPVDTTNAAWRGRVDTLRQILEVVYAHHITLKGEQRVLSGPMRPAEIRSRLNRLPLPTGARAPYEDATGDAGIGHGHVAGQSLDEPAGDSGGQAPIAPPGSGGLPDSAADAFERGTGRDERPGKSSRTGWRPT